MAITAQRKVDSKRVTKEQWCYALDNISLIQYLLSYKLTT